MRTEISQAKKEVNYYLDNVEKNKTLTKIEERKSKKRKREDDASQADQVNVVNQRIKYWNENHWLIDGLTD